MQKLFLGQSLSQKISPQQIQFIKLLQVPTAEMQKRIEEELENNPLLEEPGMETSGETVDTNQATDFEDDGFGDSNTDHENQEDYDTPTRDEYELSEKLSSTDDIDLDYYANTADISSYKTSSDMYNNEDDFRDSPQGSTESLNDTLLEQLGFLRLSGQDLKIGIQLLGSLDNSGYIRRDLDSICNDLAFGEGVFVTEADILNVLKLIQKFEPAGIGARNLQECLLIQLERKNSLPKDIQETAITIVEDFFEEFTKKHYDKIRSRINLEDPETFKDAINAITHLNPKPGDTGSAMNEVQAIIPDFIVDSSTGFPEISLHAQNAPELRVSQKYYDTFNTYKLQKKKTAELKDTVLYMKSKLDSANWFIDAIKQRQQTLLLTMSAIVDYQQEFFVNGEQTSLRPMILKDIAERIAMDISTVSRVANSKYVQTNFGTFSLKYFFSEGIATDSGEDVSNKEVKKIIEDMIMEEDKSLPLSDDRLETLLNDLGYQIARRTVAKYREALNIPVARLRRQL